MVTFYIVRHGETLLNSLGRAQGWSDSPLTDNGKRTAMELGLEIKGTIFDAAYISDTLRARQTAELILSVSGNENVKIQKDMRLREWCLGSMDAEYNTAFVQTVSEWLGVSSFTELNKRLPDVATVIFEHDTTGMAEPFKDISNRLKGVFKDMVENESYNENSNILVVTHAFAIKTLLYLFGLERLFVMERVKNTEVLRMVYDEGVFRFQGRG
ncbi:MAG: histidine phosphatase family protein [Lachnospiraceae bacterium]|nr:histidine phosphatase family protein [Lachnospiraceae bacterium]